jgi:DNA-binding IclR family transcriptional regulator
LTDHPGVLLVRVNGPLDLQLREVVAVLSVSVPTTRMTWDGVTVTATQFMHEVAGLSAVLGYRQQAAR